MGSAYANDRNGELVYCGVGPTTEGEMDDELARAIKERSSRVEPFHFLVPAAAGLNGRHPGLLEQMTDARANCAAEP